MRASPAGVRRTDAPNQTIAVAMDWVKGKPERNWTSEGPDRLWVENELYSGTRPEFEFPCISVGAFASDHDRLVQHAG